MTLPGPRVLSAAVMAVGMAVGLLMLFVPVRASFGDDPILRLKAFDRQRTSLATEVDCGPAPSNVGEPQGTGSLYDIARDGACHRVGYRRFWLAIAVASTFVAGGMVALVASEQRL
jgi:hypothetical protein